MGIKSKNMDILFKHLPQAPPALSRDLCPLFVCDVPGKTDAVQSRFTHCFFGFIYEGQGWYQVGQERYKVTAPSVITQWPGPEFRYRPESKWSELYVRFPPEALQELKVRGIFSPTRPCYPAAQPNRCYTLLTLLQDELTQPVETSSSDVIHRLINLLMLTAATPRQTFPEESLTVRYLRTLQEDIRSKPHLSRNWKHCAQAGGCSISSFRRHWMELVGMPPARYLTQVRLEAASRMLLTTSLSVSEIAAKVGYEDPLYFSRIFSRHLGMSPRHFRDERG